MNEPKFRAWDSKNGLMWNVTDIMWRKGEIVYIRGTTTFNGKEDYPIGTSFGMDSVSRADVTLLPYTGLKDKYDTEIYKGDVIRDEESGKFGKVDFELGHFYCTLDFGTDFASGVCRYGKVAGNVHENQELLNG